MAGLRELAKQLESVRMTGQMASAVKTAAAVKFSQISAALTAFGSYAAVCRDMRRRFGSALAEAFPVKDPSAPRCFVLFGANRGLSGGYSIRLYEFADRLLAEAGEHRLIVTGRHAANRYEGAGASRVFILPDIPAAEHTAAVLDHVLDLYEKGEVSSVELIFQRFINTLRQEPACSVLLPLAAGDTEPDSRWDEIIFMPDRETVLGAAAEACVRADLTAAMLEAAAGLQAATLVAMRAASDNADKSAAELESEIAHRRQSEVTSGVLETAGGNAVRGTDAQS